MIPLQIYAAGNYCHAAAAGPPDLSATLAACTANAPRRIGRFIQLALIGALRCTRDHAIPPDTGVYVASARGDLETMLDILDSLFRKGQFPRPLQFVNAVNNAACFYVAQALKLHSPSNFICNRHAAFESVLQMACLDIEAGAVRSALVGSVDLVTAPLAEHRRRLGLQEDCAVAEGSHWLWLGVPDPSLPRLGDLMAARQFASREALTGWLAEQDLSAERYQLAAGQFLDADELARLRDETGLRNAFDYRSSRACYDSQSGAVIAAFLGAGSASGLLHINAEPPCGYNAILVQR